MNISIDKKYTLSGQPFTVVTVTKPGKFPVVGHFSDGSLMSLMADGTSNYGSALIEVSPYADFVIDEKVMVRDHNNEGWRPRYFAGSESAKALVWALGGTSWSCNSHETNSWDQCRRPTAEEISE